MCMMKHVKSTFQYQGLAASLERITRLPEPEGVSSSSPSRTLHSQADSSRKKPRRNHRLLSDLQSIFGGLHTVASAGFVAAKVNMLIKEFRIVLPVSVEEYRWVSVRRSRGTVRMRLEGEKEVEVIGEQANDYMKEKFSITIETWHKPDMGEQENVHGLEKSKWDKVQVVDIDIAHKNSIPPKDYNPEHDPAIFKSVKNGPRAAGTEWKDYREKELADNPDCPHMCAYKLVSLEFKWIGLQTAVESTIHKIEKRVFTHFHRQLFCWIDKWIDLSIDDIRRIEDETKAQLDEMRKNDEVKGLGTDEN
ncbi:hypothetical protein KUCAC02_032057 [Chaenocephalus aceratus]|nr:hypothetical protein KUCAC02_032057 [Chaenocephalus aceratus]